MTDPGGNGSEVSVARRPTMSRNRCSTLLLRRAGSVALQLPRFYHSAVHQCALDDADALRQPERGGPGIRLSNGRVKAGWRAERREIRPTIAPDVTRLGFRRGQKRHSNGVECDGGGYVSISPSRRSLEFRRLGAPRAPGMRALPAARPWMRPSRTGQARLPAFSASCSISGRVVSTNFFASADQLAMRSLAWFRYVTASRPKLAAWV